MSEDTIDTRPYTGAAGGWGSMKSLAEISIREKVGPETARELTRLNKPGGVMCVSCRSEERRVGKECRL